MRIVLDTRWIFREISGIGLYTRELARHLARIDRTNEYVLLFSDEFVLSRTVEEIDLGTAANFSTRLFRHGLFSVGSQIALPLLLRSLDADVYHSTNYMIPLLAFPRSGGRTRCVVTIHDLIPLVFPDHAPKSRKTRLFPLYRRLMLEVGARAHMILTVSRSSNDDARKHLRIPTEKAGKVVTVYNGVSKMFTPSCSPEERSSRFTASLPPGTRNILYVGRCDPYKNLPCLVRALAELKSTYGEPVVLLVAGPKDARYPEAEELSAKLGVQDMVIWTGYLTETELLALYRNADVLSHASRYEGFGLQILEAMACGIPVICSNAGSLPEVAGDAAIMLEPDDSSGFARAIASVLADASLYNRMSQAGIKRAAGFTWERTAAETVSAYETVRREG